MESTETQTNLSEHRLKLVKSTTSTTTTSTTSTTTKAESKAEEIKSTESAAEKEDEVNTNYADIQYEYNVNLLGATMNKSGD